MCAPTGLYAYHDWGQRRDTWQQGLARGTLAPHNLAGFVQAYGMKYLHCHVDPQDPMILLHRTRLLCANDFTWP